MASPVSTKFLVLLFLSYVMVISGRNLELKSQVNNELSSLWDRSLGNVRLPFALEALSTPLSPSQISRLESEIRSQKYSRDSMWATTFCSAAGLACGSLNEISQIPNDLMNSFFSRSSLSSESSATQQSGKGNFGATINSDKYSWFTEKSLKSGLGTDRAYQTLGSILIGNGNALQQSFLPMPIVQALGPLSMDNMPRLLSQLNIPDDSVMALGMHFTLQRLEANTRPGAVQVPGEIVTNIVSWEDFTYYLGSFLPKSAMDRSGSRVDSNPQLNFQVLSPSASFNGKDSITANNRFRVERAELKGDVESRYASCESLTFPFQIRACRYSPQTRIYQVTLQSTTQRSQFIQTTAICYTDTRTWSPQSHAFSVVATKPGQETICRWAAPNSFTFVFPKSP